MNNSNIEVSTFSKEEIENIKSTCEDNTLYYILSLEEIITMQQHTINQAMKKIRELSNKNER